MQYYVSCFFEKIDFTFFNSLHEIFRIARKLNFTLILVSGILSWASKKFGQNAIISLLTGKYEISCKSILVKGHFRLLQQSYQSPGYLTLNVQICRPKHIISIIRFDLKGNICGAPGKSYNTGYLILLLDVSLQVQSLKLWVPP